MRAPITTLVLSLSALLLSGCSLTGTAPTVPQKTSIGVIKGTVFGGQQPISGAQLYLMAVGTGGNAGPGIAASSSNASTSLLTSVAPTTGDQSSGTYQDTSGDATNGFYYAQTNPDGSFQLSGDYVCTEGQAVYLLAFGGDTSSDAISDPNFYDNTSVGLIATLAICPASGSLASEVPFVSINEASTVAAGFGLAGYATDATHISSDGSVAAVLGIENAFVNSSFLYNIGGFAQAPIRTPNGNGVTPQLLVHSLANSLAGCVNSFFASSIQCNTLFSAATSNGTPSGTEPVETATAAINIAHYPGSNITEIFDLPTGFSSPYQPSYNTAPNDFVMAITFTGGFSGPAQIAIDSADNVWVTNTATGAVTALNPRGVPLSGSPFAGGSGNALNSIAVAPSGKIWMSDYTGSGLYEYTSSGAVVTGSPFTIGGTVVHPSGIGFDDLGNGYVTSGADVLQFDASGAAGNTYTSPLHPLTTPQPLALDNSGNFWVGDTGANEVDQINTTLGTTLFHETVTVPVGIAVDSSNNVWSVDKTGSSVYSFSNAGLAATGSPYSGGGISTPTSVAIDGAGTAFVSNSGSSSLSQITGGAVVSPTTGLTGSALAAPAGIAIDGSGDIWIANSNGGTGTTVVEFIGVATPVATPLLPGQLGARP